jgi:hypothetical protein
MEDVPEAELWVVGDRLPTDHGEPLEPYFARAERVLGPRLRRLGYRHDVARLLAASDVFALPSHFEGLPMSVVEAMLTGLPVVATDVRGPREQVADGETGFLVPPFETAPLAEALRRHGLTADDVAVVSKHDTSTEQNDPNEADLHQRLQQALGRTPGNPLLVVSQKTVTGHPKGGAAAWQVTGVLQMMATGQVPGNRNLDSVDPRLRASDHLVHGDRALRVAGDEPIRAGLVTSLGFGHVSALLALAHPGTFLAALPEEVRDDYARRADARRIRAVRTALGARYGEAPPLRRSDRRLGVPPSDPAGARDAEAAVLLDPTSRFVPAPGNGAATGHPAGTLRPRSGIPDLPDLPDIPDHHPPGDGGGR